MVNPRDLAGNTEEEEEEGLAEHRGVGRGGGGGRGGEGVYPKGHIADTEKNHGDYKMLAQQLSFGGSG